MKTLLLPTVPTLRPVSFFQPLSTLLLIGLLLGVGSLAAQADCAPPSEGLLGWWRAEGNAANVSITNVGSLQGNATYGAGIVGQCFVFDGSGDGVLSGTPARYQLQDFTIEAWVKRGSLTHATATTGADAMIVGYGGGGFGLGLDPTGRPFLSRIDIDAVYAPALLTNLAWHHLAVTKFGSAVVFYVDGVAYPVPGAYNSVFTFGSDLAIGARGDNLVSSFLGSVDEPSLYSRGLSSVEVQAIYAAGSSGKCPAPMAPQIILPPTDRTVAAGDPAELTVLAGGTAPLSYQWTRAGVSLAGATGTRLAFPSAAAADAGSYAAVVANPLGSVTSVTAVLTVLPPPPCAAPPAGLVGWWRAEGNAEDYAQANAGTPVGNVAYGPGKVGEGFVFDGNGDGIQLGNPPSLQLQNLTIEAWIQRASPTTASLSPGSGGNGALFSCGAGGYMFWIEANGNLHFNRLGDAASLSGPVVNDTVWHHVAVTRAGGDVVFYLDGQASLLTGSYGGTFSFGNSVGIGFRPDNGESSFYGRMDEVSLYDHALSAVEVQAIYTAKVSGKCYTATAPVILQPPASATAVVDDSASFTALVGGTPPLAFQWFRDGTNTLPGSTRATLALPTVQFSDAGAYWLVITNRYGAVTSEVVTLTVLAPPPCTNPPAGLLGWWRATQDAADSAGANAGTLAGNAGFAPGKVGPAFTFDGSGDAVRLGRPASLQLQDFTIELWLKRASASTGEGAIFCYGQGGYGLGMDGTGRLYITRTGVDGLYCSTNIADTAWHHVALTKAGTSVGFFIDGVAYPATTAFNSVFTFTTDVAIGARGDNLASSFNGLLDEVSVYARALTTNEIQAIYAAGGGGKCVVPAAPFIGSQPANQSVVVGGTATFTVGLGGTPPFTYQWIWNGAPLAGATAATLTLTNVQSSQAGNYAVTVSNALGRVTSSNALLSIAFPPATVRALATTAMAGGPVTVPVEIVANGNENALQFSLNYIPAVLTYASVELGTNFAEATLFVNTSQTASGRVGIILALPTGATMPPGVQQVVRVTFNTAVRTSTSPLTSPVSFGDAPTVRQLVNAQAATVSANYLQAIITLTTSILEADVNPRPNGDKSVTVADWVLLGLYAARLEYPTNASEFQRADCAPRATFGDGSIKVTDWVQAGRYAGGADVLSIVGGPTEDVPPAPGGRPPKDDGDRRLLVSSNAWFGGQTGVVAVVLQAQGNESALGFSLAFDPTRFAYLGAVKGTSSTSATLNLNASQVAAGKLGAALALSSGTFAAGDREMIKVNLRALPGATPGASPLTFADAPVPREVSDASARALPTAYLSGSLLVRPAPPLAIAHSGDTLTLTWPDWAAGFTLQTAEALPTGPWTPAPGTPVLANGSYQLTVPAQSQVRFYRLALP